MAGGYPGRFLKLTTRLLVLKILGFYNDVVSEVADLHGLFQILTSFNGP